MAVSSMPLAPQTPEWMLAFDMIIIGIVLAGIALGVGVGFKSRRLWTWGVEELAQAIVNAALLGALLAWVVAFDAVSYSWIDTSGLSCQQISKAGAQANSAANMPLYYSRCFLADANLRTVPLISSLSSLSYKLGWLSSLTISANVVQARPFSSFQDVASSYSQWANTYAGLLTAAQINFQFLELVAKSAFSIFMPVGLLLRMFFATRKLGGAILAASIGFYVIYPIAYSSLIDPNGVFASITAASGAINGTQSELSAVPIIDLGKSGDIANLIAELSGGDLSSSATSPYPTLASSRASLELALVFYPLMALGVTLFAIRELYLVLGSEFNINLFELV